MKEKYIKQTKKLDELQIDHMFGKISSLEVKEMWINREKTKSKLNESEKQELGI